jgi:hypothetical protein
MTGCDSQRTMQHPFVVCLHGEPRDPARGKLVTCCTIDRNIHNASAGVGDVARSFHRRGDDIEMELQRCARAAARDWRTRLVQ